MGLLIKAAAWLALIGIVTWGLHHLHNYIYTSGQNDERLVWQDKERYREEKELILVNQAREEVAEEAHKQQLNLARVIDEKSEKIKTIERDIAAVNKRGLFISAKVCPDNRNSMPGTASDSIDPIATTAGIRLPREITERLTATAGLANETTALYLSCKSLLEAANVEIIYPEVEKKREN